jgi:TatD DNase family protein
MSLTDTHCHLNFQDFDKDRTFALSRAWDAGIERILVPGIDLDTSQAATKLAEKHAQIYAAVGTHPNSANKWDVRMLGFLDELTCHPKVVAVGEIGLDYYRDWTPQPLQKRIFKEQLDMAAQLDLPVVIHTRNSTPKDRSCINDVLEILAGFQIRGVLHSFSGNMEEAKRALDLGFFLGITGPVTFKKAVELREIVAAVPLDCLLIETDSPFLTPVPHRGKRNEPAFVRFVAQKLGEIHSQPPDVVAEITSANARRLFQWSD